MLTPWKQRLCLRPRSRFDFWLHFSLGGGLQASHSTSLTSVSTSVKWGQFLLVYLLQELKESMAVGHSGPCWLVENSQYIVVPLIFF